MDELKKIYEEPVIEVIDLSGVDAIIASMTTDDYGEYEVDEDDW